MAIRINLLAEAQALEEMRKRDPVKRAIWAGVLVILLILAWSSSLQLKSIIANGELSRLEGQIASLNSQYKMVVDKQRRLADGQMKMAKLQELTRGRLLYGTVLNALQQNTMDDVQLVRLRADQNFSYVEEVKAKTNAEGQVTAGRPATATERILLTLDARDGGPSPGDQVNKFKQVLSESPYFAAVLGKTNEMRLASLSPPTALSADTKPFVLFTLECRYPEKTR